MLTRHDDPDDIRGKDSLPYLFPCPIFVKLLGQLGFDDIALNDEGGQVNTFNLQMTALGAGLTVPAVRRQLAQTVEQIRADKGVTWRVASSVAIVEGQNIRAQIAVAYVDKPQ